MAELDVPAVSIVVPVYNSARMLGRCLVSICAQTTADDQVIVVDDGSTDDVATVADRFPVTVVRLDRRSGAAAARNQGADRSTRPVLLFVDADVVLHGDVIARGRAHFADRS